MLIDRVTRKLCCAVLTASLLLMIGLMAAKRAGAQQPLPAAVGPRPVDLITTIKRLEARINELETRLSHMEPAARTRDATAIAAAAMNSRNRGGASNQPEMKNGILQFFESTEISGFVDAYYGYNFNRPAADAQLRNFDTKHNQFGFNLAELAIEKKPIPESRLGFRMDLNFGEATEIVHSFEPGGAEVFKNIQQGYLSYLAPVGDGLQLDVGKFVTQHGAEVIETKDNWNYSRSLMFALAIPYYHFGLRATYPVSDKLTLSGFLVNGWNNVVDNNSRKTIGVLAVIKPNSKLTLVQNYMAGPEQAGNDDDWRQLSDTTLTYTVSRAVSLMANYDYGFDRVSGARVRWQGLAAYARVQATRWLAFSPRFEWYEDHDGFTSGTRQTLKEFTLTSEHRIDGGLLTRLEYRRDFTDKPFFLKPADRLVKAQSTIAFGLVYGFSSNGEP